GGGGGMSGVEGAGGGAMDAESTSSPPACAWGGAGGWYGGGSGEVSGWVGFLGGWGVWGLEPPVRPSLRSPPRRKERLAWAAWLMVLELPPLHALSKLPAPATAPVTAIPRRNWRRPIPSADRGVLL